MFSKTCSYYSNIVRASFRQDNALKYLMGTLEGDGFPDEAGMGMRIAGEKVTFKELAKKSGVCHARLYEGQYHSKTPNVLNDVITSAKSILSEIGNFIIDSVIVWNENEDENEERKICIITVDFIFLVFKLGDDLVIGGIRLRDGASTNFKRIWKTKDKYTFSDSNFFSVANYYAYTGSVKSMSAYSVDTNSTEYKVLLEAWNNIYSKVALFENQLDKDCLGWNTIHFIGDKSDEKYNYILRSAKPKIGLPFSWFIENTNFKHIEKYFDGKTYEIKA